MAKRIGTTIPPIGTGGFGLPVAKTFMHVDFTVQQLRTILINSMSPQRTVVGLMLRLKKLANNDLTLDAIKIERNNVAFPNDLPDLEALVDNTAIPSVVGKAKKILGLPPSFASLDTFKYVYFEIDVINKMLLFKADTEGLRFKRVKIEMDNLPIHQSLAVAPYPISIVNRVGGDIEGVTTTAPLQDFITYSIGYACPPMWPPDFQLLTSSGL